MARVAPLVLLTVLMLTLQTAHSRSPVRCNPNCNKIYDPVCGSDGKRYNNRCRLNYASCRFPDITFLNKGECTNPCLHTCDTNWAPVCGRNGKTYRNVCFQNNAWCGDPSITLHHNGACKERKCGKFCPPHFSPVCDHTGKQYPNSCFLNIAICEDTSIRPGICRYGQKN